MKTERWAPDLHIPLLSEWLEGWGHASGAGDARLYPSTGFVVDRCAIGFVYATNAPLVGYLDGIVTDPAARVRRRFLALERLCALLQAEASALGIELLCAATNVRGLVGICRRSGFVVHGNGYQYIAKLKG